jgi:hypothetical protein
MFCRQSGGFVYKATATSGGGEERLRRSTGTVRGNVENAPVVLAFMAAVPQLRVHRGDDQFRAWIDVRTSSVEPPPGGAIRSRLGGFRSSRAFQRSAPLPTGTAFGSVDRSYLRLRHQGLRRAIVHVLERDSLTGHECPALRRPEPHYHVWWQHDIALLPCPVPSLLNAAGDFELRGSAQSCFAAPSRAKSSAEHAQLLSELSI